jgi:peptidoglycan/xylan/chitin deacetylase (PgdA/CDA1 family)
MPEPERSKPLRPAEANPPDAPYATRWREAAQLPVGLRQRAKRLLRDGVISVRARLNAAGAARSEPQAGPAFLRCLFCHYVFDDQRESFARIIRALQTVGRFVTTEECIAMMRGERRIVGRCFHLSLDDGFLNNATNAAPVLRDLGVHATLFVPSAMVGADDATVRAYCRRIGYPAPIRLMSWDDAARLAADGFEIGSHTRTHARFSDISSDPTRLEDEIAGSKREIEARLGLPCRTISWPFGKRTDADTMSLAAAERAGYEACFGAYRGTVIPGRTNRFSVPRHHFEAEWPLDHVLYFARGNMESSASFEETSP